MCLYPYGKNAFGKWIGSFLVPGIGFGFTSCYPEFENPWVQVQASSRADRHKEPERRESILSLGSPWAVKMVG